MSRQKYDFCGWATRNDLRCSDGRTIRKNAFAQQDGKRVPLVYMHDHEDPTNVLGHAMLENRDEGVYAYCFLNSTPKGQHVKEMIAHGDVDALSINAGNLQQRNGDVLHGVIKEVSIVLAGANPGAYIEFPQLEHSDEFAEDRAVIYTGELIHGEGELEMAEEPDDPDAELSHADEGDKGTKQKETTDPKAVFEHMSEEQKEVVYFLIGAALRQAGVSEAKHSDMTEEDENKMKRNVFDQTSEPKGATLSHADQETIIKMAKSSQVGTLQGALALYAENNEIKHADISGFDETSLGMLFPEYRDLKTGAPELITNDQSWIPGVLRKTSKTPYSRIRTRQVDIRKLDDLRAKGFVKGNRKNETGNYTLARRTTDPQTIYVKNALNRDDITDITDFDYVAYQYNIDRMMLNEELATAILLGDGREEGHPDKIEPTHIRPIWTDDELYTIHALLDIAGAKEKLQGSNTSANFGDSYVYAESVIETLLYSREQFRGSGTPDFYCTPHLLNVMLLARDLNGRRIYDNKRDLAAALNVGEIITVEQFENRYRTVVENGSTKNRRLLAMIVNLADYNVGSTKGGEITHFRQFDIDFNQEKSLIETRVSGALTRLWSAIVLEEDATA